MKFDPLPYQPAMLDWLQTKDTAALFVSPGMGKTVVTLTAIADAIGSGRSRGALIIAPWRVCTITWPNQVEHWDHCQWMKIANLRTPAGLKAWENGSADIYVINPDMLPSVTRNLRCRVCNAAGCPNCKKTGFIQSKSVGIAEKLFKNRTRIPVDTFVWDELSQAKDPTGKRANSIRPYLSMFSQRWGLTGTPVPNSYLDLFAQIRMLDDGERLGRSFTGYRSNYFEQADYMGYSYKLRPGAKELIDKKLSDLALVMLGDDWLKLPVCETEDVNVELPSHVRREYKTLEKELLVELAKGDIVARNAATLVGKLLQLTSGAVYDDDRNVHVLHDAKIEALKKLRKKHGKEPMLVLTAFQHEMARVLEAIPGARKFDEKDLADWQAGKIHTWVAQPQSLSHGIDGIQRGGRIAVWMTLTYSNETYLQTNARLVRTGQSRETKIYRVICVGTADDGVAESLRDKSDTQAGLLNALKAIQRLAT